MTSPCEDLFPPIPPSRKKPWERGWCKEAQKKRTQVSYAPSTVTNSHRSPYSQSPPILLGYGNEATPEMRGSKTPKFAGAWVIAAGRTEGSWNVTPPAIYEKAEYTWAGELNKYMRKVSGMTRDRQKQLGTWNRKFGRLLAWDPVRIAFLMPLINSTSLSHLFY